MDFFDIIHYLIGLAILVSLLWLLIKVDNFLRKDNNNSSVINKIK
jgi:hypothetical protein